MKYARYALLVLFLVPVVTVFTRSVPPAGKGLAILWCAVPALGVSTRKTWVFYYIYVAVPLTLVLGIGALWLLSLFGDQAYSLSAIASLLWPVVLYCAAVVVLTIVLHVRPGRRS